VSTTSDATPQRPTSNDDREGWKAYWAAQRTPWRTEPEVDEERQRYLAERRAVQPDIERGLYPFKGIEPKLTRADVEWLLATHESDGVQGPIDPDDQRQGKRLGVDLRGASLEHADLRGLPLARVIGSTALNAWRLTTEEQRNGAIMRLSGANLQGADLRGAILRTADLSLAALRDADLRGADLHRAWMYRAFLPDANLAGANLHWAHLEGAWLPRVNLGGVNLKGAYFDTASDLANATLGDHLQGYAAVADVRWDGLNLSTIQWSKVPTLGDEVAASRRQTADGMRKAAQDRLSEQEAAVRAYRQLAIALRNQGLNEPADRFAYRAQMLQRRTLRRQRHYLRALGSWLLDLICGYGYRPLRSFLTYAVVVLGFAVAYFVVAAQVGVSMPPLAAVIFSVTSFHGRGFAPGEHVPLTNPLTVLAAGEAIIGLLIEITFIATFTQRFFAR
jgi:uncharacterized protein YjbI with pentapeptide repeats